MQGTWLVSIKSKEAAFPQQFEIAGAAAGNGVYPHTHAGEVFVTGTSWTIQIRHNPGSGFRSSQMKLKFPTAAGGFYQFDIQSNDSGGDQDFNDFILTCRTPIVAGDYLIYGAVSDYAGPCLFNPCNRFWVIDSFQQLTRALQVPALRRWLKEMYPDRVKEALKPVPVPGPGPVEQFVPMMVPAPGDLATPLKQQFRVQTEEHVLTPDTVEKGKKAAYEPVRYLGVKSITAIEKSTATISPELLRRRAELEGVVFKIPLFCDSDPLPNVRVRFWEYDRTAAEKSGEPYTGTGTREYLGSTYTDDFGNYIFRFSRAPEDVVDELVDDLAGGEDALVQSAPDLIAQVMQPLDPYVMAFETAPYWNISPFRRINICVPRENIGIRPLACEGQHILQGVGNIVLGSPNADGSRTGFGNVLASNGVITAHNSLGPTVECAAWNGTLLLRGCLSNPAVKYYTLEHRRPGGAWSPLDIHFTLPIFIGAFQTNLPVNQGIFGGMPIYLNVETDAGDWLMAYRNIKAKLSTAVFPENGPRQIRITGLDAARVPVAGVQETVTLFIINNGIDLQIDPVLAMAGAGSVSECGLFTLPAGNDSPEVTVRFKATQFNAPPVGGGFMNAYELSVNKGASGFGVLPGTTTSAAPYTTPPGNRGRAYVPAAGGGLSCNLGFFGTINEPSDVGGYIEVQLTPAAGGWLDPGQQFCTFGLFLSGSLRRTDGQTANWTSWATPVLFGIQRAPAPAEP